MAGVFVFKSLNSMPPIFGLLLFIKSKTQEKRDSKPVGLLIWLKLLNRWVLIVYCG